jgi:hypothetical protein
MIVVKFFQSKGKLREESLFTVQLPLERDMGINSAVKYRFLLLFYNLLVNLVIFRMMGVDRHLLSEL